MQKEIWKTIIDYEGLYSASNLGNIKSHSREVWNGYKFYLKPERILISTINNWGYLKLTLSKNGNKRYCKVHRLIAQSFISNPENKPEVNHKNGIKTDNRIENLEWNTYSENRLHACQTGLSNPYWKDKKNLKITGGKHYGSKKVIEIKTGKLWESAKDCARELGINYNTLTYRLNKHIDGLYGLKYI